MLIYGTLNTRKENQQPVRLHPQLLLTSFYGSLNSIVQVYIKLYHHFITKGNDSALPPFAGFDFFRQRYSLLHC